MRGPSPIPRAKSSSSRYILDMRRRLILGPILVVLAFFVIWAEHEVSKLTLPPWLDFLTLADGTTAPGLILLPVGCVICTLASLELAQIYRAAGMAASKRVVVFAAIIGVITGGLAIGAPERSLLGPYGGKALATAAALVVAWALLVHVRNKEIKGACGAAGAALMAFVYSGVILGFLMAIRAEFSAWVVLGVILTAKSCDIGAYFTGSFIGRHKLIPWISPGKTWEGLVGGMVSSGLVGVGLVLLAQRYSGLAVFASNSPIHGFVAGAFLGLAAQLGDLSASILKRDAGIKDSGQLIPGIGGIIDVIDSMVLAGPAAFWYLTLLKKTVVPLPPA